MSEGFYRRLEIQQNSTLAEIRAAFQRKSAFLMRRLQQARALEANDAAVQQQLSSSARPTRSSATPVVAACTTASGL